MGRHGDRNLRAVDRVANGMVSDQNHTDLDPDPYPFLNNGSGCGSDFDSEPVLLDLDPILIEKLGPSSGTEST